MEATLEEKKQFLIKYPTTLSYHVSEYYPLSHEQLRRYKDILQWDYVATNEKIAWSTDIIDEFKDRLFRKADEDLPASLSVNDTLPWDSIEFVKRYEDLWDWEHMCENDILKGECRAYYLERLQQCEWYRPPSPPTVVEPEKELDPNDPLYELLTREWTQEDIDQSDREFHDRLLLHDEDWCPSLSWEHLSEREDMYWSEELIDKFLDKWYWAGLSSNLKLPWSPQLLKKYEDRWAWEPREYVDRDGDLTTDYGSISQNSGILWTVELLNTYGNRLSRYNSILHSTSTQWTLTLLDCYVALYGERVLFYPNHLWQSLFAEFNEQENMMAVLDEVVESGFKYRND